MQMSASGLCCLKQGDFVVVEGTLAGTGECQNVLVGGLEESIFVLLIDELGMGIFFA